MALSQKHRLLLFPKINKYIFVFFCLALIVAGFRAYQLFGYIFYKNVQKDYILYITDRTTFQMVCDSLKDNKVMRTMKAFNWVASKKDCQDMIKPGRYHFKTGMNSNQAVNILRAGLQEPVHLTFNNIRTKEQLAGTISHYIEADSLSILGLFNPETVREYGFTPENFPVMFIPNTYEFFWTTSAKGFGDRMKTEYNSFWNSDRQAKALELGMSPVDVAILASIVQEETNKKSEKPRIAGVYINRLRKGMLLQADPTVKYAKGDMSLKRILNKFLETDSPYNTYLYPGLPPGPITFPEIQSIDAVLNYEKHNLMYFCAKEDLSGFHNFARTQAEHGRNAARYHAALDSLKRVKIVEMSVAADSANKVR